MKIFQFSILKEKEKFAYKIHIFFFMILYFIYCLLYLLLRPKIPQFSAFSLIPIILFSILKKNLGLIIAILNFPIHLLLLYILGKSFNDSFFSILIPFSTFILIAFVTGLLVDLNRKNKKIIEQLNDKIEENKRLKQLVPICAKCKKIRDDSGYWNQLEQFITDNSDIVFSHGYCPDCAEDILSQT